MPNLNDIDTKPLWHSKTFWANVVALGTLGIQHYFGVQLDADAQVSIIAGVNIMLRAITKTGIS